MEALLALANIPLAQIETEAARLLGSGIAIGLGLIRPGIYALVAAIMIGFIF